ncbi:MAG: response regulator [Candidatus Yonathbacteria bacterium]|nr:response regulator [Candidatus Yonathbacteria bacterium]
MDKPKKKILLIDDNEVMRIMFSNIFWIHGLDDEYEITAISNVSGAEAILADEKTRPDIILTGLVMPFEKDGRTTTTAEAGFTLLKRIKEDPVLSHIRVIIFSSYEDEEYQKKALALGAERYLKKKENLPQDIMEVIRSSEK